MKKPETRLAAARGSALDDVLNTFEDAVKWSTDNTRSAQYEFRSDVMREAAEGALREQNEFLKAKAMMEGTKKAFARNFALYDNIAQGSEDLARLLVSDATSVGARRPSVVDYKRNLTLEKSRGRQRCNCGRRYTECVKGS